MTQNLDYFEIVKTFPGNNMFSSYNIKVILHFLQYLPSLMFKGKHEFYKKIVHKILQELSALNDEEIKYCLMKTLEKNKLQNPNSLRFLENGFIYPMVLYLAIRVHKPEIIVETGVHNGRSTSFILQAITDNKKGKLFSIDLGHDVTYESESGTQVVTFPKNLKPGWLVPKKLKSYWKLIIGNSKTELPKLLQNLGQIDFFSHDGEHTDSAMMFEYELAYKLLRKKGVIMSDDVLFGDDKIPTSGYLHNVPHYNAWLDFSKNKDGHLINFRVGYLMKDTKS